MSKQHRNIPLLGLCLCLMMSGSSLIMASAALTGEALAPSPSYATLPLAAFFIATMCTTFPAGLLMERLGRKPVLLLATLFGMSGALLAGCGILWNQFAAFIAGVACIGIFNGFGNFFRFAAADSVAPGLRSRAISQVMIGGVFAALIGPNLATYSRDWLPQAEFAASYLSITLLYAGIALSLVFVRLEEKAPEPELKTPTTGGRPLLMIASQPAYLVALVCGMLGYGTMTFVMTATPLAMHDHHHAFEATSLVIQWHVLAMYLPSFFTGHLISRFGAVPVMFCGVLLDFACVGLNLAGTSQSHFLLALVCLGLGWSFLFIGATSLLTGTYQPEERHRAQALNDFSVFSTVALASLSAGVLQNLHGWETVNRGVIPLLLIMLGSLVWLWAGGYHREAAGPVNTA